MKKDDFYFVTVMVLVFAILIISGNSSGEGISLSGNVLNYGDSSKDRIIVPVKVHLVKDTGFGHFTTTRDGNDIKRVFVEVNRIWEQSGVYFSIDDIIITEFRAGVIRDALDGNATKLFMDENFDSNVINLFFVHDLNGLNGLALTPIKAALVADFTTVNDYRTTAHEFGHILGLQHVGPSERLMARGVNGELLDDWEIEIARGDALDLFA